MPRKSTKKPQSELALEKEQPESDSKDVSGEDSPQATESTIGNPLEPDSDALRSTIDSNFLQYAAYVIRDRAIPRIEDGLKPVQRRILYALHRNDDGKFIKVANIVGYAMQFHPHGDASITDALVVLTNKRYLIEGQGNFGNIYTGDKAAASRYIECRLTKLAREHIFHDELTEFVPSYDGRNKEPVTLPVRLPLLLMLGTEGIAVGMSAKVLPHNFLELLEAQIAILQRKPFQVLPDFIQGGLMDASEYQDGLGSVRLRARIEAKDASTLQITEIPFGTTTESLINSIEDANKKSKIKIRSINDFTAEKIEIEIKLSPGSDADTTIQALYAFTDCETSVSSRITVIQGDRPVELTVSQVLKFNTRKLVQDLEDDLNLQKKKLEDELHFKTLVQIFVENRIYKRIEECRTADAVSKAIYTGFEPFKKQLFRWLNDKDVEMLLGVHIRRISLFDINKHKEEMEKIKADLAEIEKHLKSLTRYAVKRLKSLIKEYQEAYTRRTEIATFQAVAAKKVAVRTLNVAFDKERGYLGHQVNGKDRQIKCSPFDKIIVVWTTGEYKMIPVPDKLYVGKNILYIGHYDRDTVFTAAYTHRDCTYLKRFTFGGAIQNKEYRLAPEKSKVPFFEEGTPEELYLKYSPKSGQRIHQQIAYPTGLSVKNAKAKGNQMTVKKIAKLSGSRPRGWDDALNGPKLAFGS